MNYLKKIRIASCAKKNETGQVMVESLLCMMLICLIFFGLLQLFYYGIAVMTTEYSSFCGARSASVGFREELVQRSVNVASIPASGRAQRIWARDVTYYDPDMGEPIIQFQREERIIPVYLSEGNRRGVVQLRYEYWNKGYDEQNNTLYDYNRKVDNADVIAQTSLTSSITDNNNLTDVNVYFNHYPFTIPMAEAFTNEDRTITINKSASIRTYYDDYLE